jgi:hypothetical protein
MGSGVGAGIGIAMSNGTVGVGVEFCAGLDPVGGASGADVAAPSLVAVPDGVEAVGMAFTLSSASPASVPQASNKMGRARVVRRFTLLKRGPAPRAVGKRARRNPFPEVW